MRNNKRHVRKDRTTTMPASMEAMLESSAGASVQSNTSGREGLTAKEQKELDQRFKLRYTKKALYGRKEDRKQKRVEKKNNRVQLTNARSAYKKVKASEGGVMPMPDPLPSKSVAGVQTPQQTKQTNSTEKDGSRKPGKKSPTASIKSTEKARNSDSSLKKPVKDSSLDDAETTRRKLAKIQEKNPALYKMLQSTSVGVEAGIGQKYGMGGGIGAWSADGTSPYDRDDAEIEYYSKKLGKKEKVFKNSLKKDGLDELFDSLDTREGSQDLKSLQDRSPKKSISASKQLSNEKQAKKTVEQTKATKSSKTAVDSNSKATTDKSRNLNKESRTGKGTEVEEDDDMMDFNEEDDDDSLLGDLAGGNSDEDDSEDDFDFGDQSDVELTDMEQGSEDDLGDDPEAMDEDDEDSDDEDDEGLEITFEDTNNESDGEDMEVAPRKSAKQPSAKSKRAEPDEEIDSAPAAKYIPPRLRAQATNQSEQYLRLKRQAQGLLNRLSDTNMESIITGLEECYRNNSRHDVTEIITESVISFISNHSNLLDSFVMTYAALISAIFNLIGIEFGAHLTQTAVELYLKSMEEISIATAKMIANPEDHQTADGDNKLSDLPSKRATNLITLVSHLYNFQIVGAPLIYDFVRMSLDRMQELDVELILKVLRVCGSQMRSDDPSALKNIVTIVHERSVKNADPAFNTPRVKFMIETIMDLKNNKHKSSKKNVATGASGAATSLQHEKLSKFISNLLRRRGVPDREALRVTLDDIKNVHSKGKWWLVGSAWAGHSGDGSTVRSGVDSATAVQDSVEGAGTDLLKLAKAQRMTTDIRRGIFVILMSSEDFVDAYEKLTRLNLKSKQEREIVRVLLHCCTNEKTYNPYYYLVATKFCSASHSFKITFQYALWDSIREFENGDDEDDEDEEEDGESAGRKILRRVSHLAKFYSTLVSGGFLGLTILKSLDFATMSAYPALYCQLFFTHLLTSAPPVGKSQAQTPEAHVRSVFERLKALKESQDLCEGMEFFLEQYVLPRSKDGKPRMGVAVDSLGISVPDGGNLVDVLKRRVKIAKEILLEDDE
ncbi:suppressor of glycerol defect [Chytriomyces hyalinus]|nr:suppressor of glycerol defect [Chytriomyces hyalinus]